MALEQAVQGSLMTPGVRPVIAPLLPPQLNLDPNQAQGMPFWQRSASAPLGAAPLPSDYLGADPRAAALEPAQQQPAQPAQSALPQAPPPEEPTAPSVPAIPGGTTGGWPSAAPTNSAPRSLDPSGQPTREAITRAAQEGGISPAYALGVADRESSFNPSARNSKSIYGLFQMSGELRQKHGSGDSDDPYVQAQGFASHTKAVKGEMAGVLGREPSDAETYLGHHFGARRAARILSGGSPQASVGDYFTPSELAQNPHIVKAGTIGNLVSSTLSDINGRMRRFGGEGETAPTSAADPASYGTEAIPAESAVIDPAAYGTAFP